MFTVGGAAERGQHLEGAGACFASALLLVVLTAVATYAAGTSRWILALAVVGVGLLVALGVNTYAEAPGSRSEFDSGQTLWTGALDALVIGSWPLIIVTVVVVARRANRVSA